MHDIIASARREARRRARTDGAPLQGHLDTIAREAGRSRWSAFLADPTQVGENILDRLVREAQEDGYDGLEIEAGSLVPAKLGPMLVKAFRMVDGQLRVDLFRLGWDDGVHLAPFIRKRFDKPQDCANWEADCGGRTVFLYNDQDVVMAFHFPETGAEWREVHDMRAADALESDGDLPGWWRGREGRSLVEVAADRDLHHRHVRKLRQVMASPQAPAVRYDPFCRTAVPSKHLHPDLVRAHFEAIAEIVVPEGTDAAEQRLMFTEIALRMNGHMVRCEWDERTAGLPDFPALARGIWLTMLGQELPTRLSHIPVHRLTSAVNQLTTKMHRFTQGALARATDGNAELLRRQRSQAEWEHEVAQAFMRANPGFSATGPAYEAWMTDARKAPDAPPRPSGYHYG